MIKDTKITFITRKINLYNIIKRFTGNGKNIGHAHKILSLAEKNNHRQNIHNNNNVTNNTDSNTSHDLTKYKSYKTTEDNTSSNKPDNNISNFKKVDDLKLDSTKDSISSINNTNPSSGVKKPWDWFSENRESANVFPNNSSSVPIVPPVIFNQEITYRGVYVNEKYYIVTPYKNLLGISHDADHVIVAKEIPNDSLELTGRTTSSKGGTSEGKITNIKLSNEKYDGTYIEMPKNPQKTGMDEDNNRLPPIVNDSNIIMCDDFGDSVPHKIKGGQYYQPYEQSRIITSTEKEKLNIEENPQATQYLNRPDIKTALDAILDLKKDVDSNLVLSEESYNEMLTESEIYTQDDES